MFQVKSHAAYREDPLRSIAGGDKWLVWQASDTVGGLAFGDRVDFRAMAELIGLFSSLTVQTTQPFTVLFDIRHVRDLDREGFGEMLKALVSMKLPFKSLDLYPIAHVSVASVALLGLAHLRISSSLNTPRSSYRQVEALADADAIELMAAVDRHFAPNVVDRLTAWLATQTQEVKISHAARALGVSTRSLQRALTEANTTYREQTMNVKRQRLADAVLRTDDKLDAVAVSLGFTSGSSLSTTFKRVFGQSPSEFRKACQTATRS